MFEPLTQRLKRLSDDERAVSPVVGFVLIFALIMLVFTIYQADVVPAQNKEVEFEHSQTVDGQMSQLSDKLIETAVTRERRSATIDTGLEYPSRVLAINPGNPAGTLQTVDTSDVTVSGIETEEGTTATCTYEDLSFLRYQPNYNRLDEETTYSIEYGMLVQDYSSSDATNLQSEGVAFPEGGNEAIQLTLIEGDIQKSQMTTSVSTELVHNYTTIRSESGGTVTLPTTLSEDGWTDLLDDKDNLQLSGYTDNSGSPNSAEIAIDPDGTGRTIRIKKVTPGGADNTDNDGCDRKRYIENETSLTPDAAVDTDESLSVSVHDQFGNPITSNVTVDASTTGTGSLDVTSRNLNGSGQAPFTYDPVEAESGSTVGVTASLQNGSENGPITFGLEYPELEIENVTWISPPGASLDSPTELIVRTFDESDNSLSGIDIDASTTGAGTLTPTNTDSDSDGTKTFTYNPSSSDSGDPPEEVTASLPNGSADDSVTFELEYPTDEDSEGDSDDSLLGSGDITNGYGLEPSIVTIDSAEYEGGGNSKVTFEFHNRGSGDDPAMKAVKVQLNGMLGGPSESPTSGEFNEEPINFNGEVVNLKPDGGTPDNTFTLATGEEQSIVLDNLDENINDGGLLLVTVEYEYEYTEDGETKTGTDTSTYAVAVSRSTGASPELPAPFERVLSEPGPQPE